MSEEEDDNEAEEDEAEDEDEAEEVEAEDEDKAEAEAEESSFLDVNTQNLSRLDLLHNSSPPMPKLSLPDRSEVFRSGF